MTKRTAPSLVLALALVLAASGPAFATRGNRTSIPEVITVSDVSIRIPDQGLTEVTIHGDFPLNYLVYQPDRNKLVLEVRDCDASMLDVDFPTTSSQVMAFEAEVAEDADGAAVSRFKFDLAPRVSHSIEPDGNDLLVRFTGGLHREGKGRWNHHHGATRLCAGCCVRSDRCRHQGGDHHHRRHSA